MVRRRLPTSVFLGLLLLLAALPLRAKDDWLPITAADLNYKDPAGAAAVMLYLQEDTDGQLFTVSDYERIKVLTDEGKKYADVKVPYVKDFTRIEDLDARVVQPDGSIVKFDGKVYDKVEVKYRSVRVLNRAFTLPDVRPGSIIEYRYKIRFEYPTLLDTDWPLQFSLPIKKARFTLKPYGGPSTVKLRLSWIGIHIPLGVEPNREGDRFVLELNNLPALPDERYSPPEDWTRGIVRFVYTADEDVTLAPEDYWKKKSSRWGEWTETFLSKHKKVDHEVVALIQPGDTPDAKLRKLYARAQQVRNLNFERRKTEKEAKHEKLKDNENVDDVLDHGYGSARDVNLLYVAMVRSAGFDAALVWAATRDHTPFMREIIDPGQLRDHVVLVKLADKQLFLDPATPFCPFGLLNWMDTDVPALPVGKAGPNFVTTPTPHAADAVTSRRANLRLADGQLTGTVTLSFTGLEALRWRLDFRHEDDVARHKELEAELKKSLPSAATVDLATVTGWDKTDEPLVADFKVTVPNAVTQTGKRLLFPAGLFQGNDVHPFRHADRKLPVYFSHPFRETDDVTIELPPGYQLEGASQPHNTTAAYGAYQRQAAFTDNKLHLERQLQVDRYIFQPQEYYNIRSFYDVVRAGDEETLVLKVVNP